MNGIVGPRFMSAAFFCSNVEGSSRLLVVIKIAGCREALKFLLIALGSLSITTFAMGLLVPCLSCGAMITMSN
uniref:Uncharacterized protein n=1 Tax=Physcomitrium patens TaxID=3218 RepID=A0A2K1IBQ0_PHYPA|nr:hypothetical protein PHYPA_030186 [Physcomitrium patens]